MMRIILLSALAALFVMPTSPKVVLLLSIYPQEPISLFSMEVTVSAQQKRCQVV